MTKIKATGRITGSEPDTIIVETVKGDVKVTAPIWVKDILDVYLEFIPPIGGTYRPDRHDILAYYSIFTNSDFFQEEPEIKITGELPTIDYEDGVIY